MKTVPASISRKFLKTLLLLRHHLRDTSSLPNTDKVLHKKYMAYILNLLLNTHLK